MTIRSGERTVSFIGKILAIYLLKYKFQTLMKPKKESMLNIYLGNTGNAHTCCGCHPSRGMLLMPDQGLLLFLGVTCYHPLLCFSLFDSVVSYEGFILSVITPCKIIFGNCHILPQILLLQIHNLACQRFCRHISNIQVSEAAANCQHSLPT